MAYSDFTPVGNNPLYATFAEPLKDSNLVSFVNIPEYGIQCTMMDYGKVLGNHYYPLIHTWIDGKLVFYGDTLFGFSPMWAIDSLKGMANWLEGMCIQKRDTDSDFFKFYTKDMLEWRDGQVVGDFRQEIIDYVNDNEEVDEETGKTYKKLSKRWIKQYFTAV